MSTPSPWLGVLAFLLIQVGASAADHMPGHEAPRLRPIAESIAGVDFHRLEILPVQHGGRYKPFLAFGMETIDGINGQNSLGAGHTPVTSTLDLLFCRNAYESLPVVVVKNPDLRRDLGAALPAEERERLRNEGTLTPSRLASQEVQAALTDLGRQTIKTKAINQVNHALVNLDAGRLLESLRLLPIPAGPHRDQWRNPIDIAPEFPVVLQNFLATAQQARGDLAAYGRLSWGLLPLAPETAARLELTAIQVQQINRGTLWTLWKTVGAGAFSQAQIAALAQDPAQVAVVLGLPATEAGSVTEGVKLLASHWPRLQLPVSDLADPTVLPAFAGEIAAVTTAWNDLGWTWSEARRADGPRDPQVLQARIDALSTAVDHLRTLFEADRQQRGLPPLETTTALEVTYWHMNGFSGVAWLFLLAIPCLALGAIGGNRLALGIGMALSVLGISGQVLAFSIRWILAQRVPLANLYESMAAAALLCSLFALAGEILRWSRRRHQSPVNQGGLLLASSLFGCLIILAQAFLERHDINAFISPAMPILSEFWLRVHTACIVASYGIIGLGGLMSGIYLLMRLRLPDADPRCEAWERSAFAINCLATVVLWIGLVLGAVWAAVSWGRPWGWDPKEVFALLTWIVFIILVHLRHAVPKPHRGTATAWTSLAALLVMAFNWYWVNVQLAGLHSYA